MSFSLGNHLKRLAGIRRSPWTWMLLLGIALFLAFPGATAWKGDQAAIIQTALEANAAGRPATDFVRLGVSNRLASPATIWFYQLLLLATRNPILLTFLKNLSLLVALLGTGSFLCRRLEIPALPPLCAILLLPKAWLMLRPLDDAGLALPFALLAFGATVGFCTEATDHPIRELVIALVASLACAVLSLLPAIPMATLALALLLAPPNGLANHRRLLHGAGIVILLLATAHYLWLMKATRDTATIPVGRSLLALSADLPQFASSWKLSLTPSPDFLRELQELEGPPAVLNLPWLLSEYLTYALALMGLAAGIIAAVARKQERHLIPLVFGALLSLSAIAVFLVSTALLRRGAHPRDMAVIFPAMIPLWALGFHSLKVYLRFPYDLVRAFWFAFILLATVFYLGWLCICAGDDTPEHFGSTLSEQWAVARSLSRFEQSGPKPLVFNRARCLQHTPQLLTTLCTLASHTTQAPLPPDGLPRKIVITQYQEGTGLLCCCHYYDE
ncbi:MAG: hypothetical protein IKS83_03650 [Victivallales bacterium]|nr:hypothetical protein [Victivallales bacterium]